MMSREKVFMEEASEVSEECFNNLMVGKWSPRRRPGSFDRLLKNIKQEIEFCMEYEIDKDLDVPLFLMESLVSLRENLEGYLK